MEGLRCRKRVFLTRLPYHRQKRCWEDETPLRFCAYRQSVSQKSRWEGMLRYSFLSNSRKLSSLCRKWCEEHTNGNLPWFSLLSLEQFPTKHIWWTPLYMSSLH